MKKVVFVLMFVLFFCFTQNVLAASPDKFKVVHGREWDKVWSKDDNKYVIRTLSGIQVSWLIGEVSGKQQEIYCIDYNLQAPDSNNGSCFYKKTKYYTDDPGVLTIVNHSDVKEEDTFQPSSQGGKWLNYREEYHMRKAVLYKYFQDKQNEYLFNDGMVTVSQVLSDPSWLKDWRWNIVDDKTSSKASELLTSAKSSKKEQNDSEFNPFYDKKVKGKCLDGKYVLSSQITIEGKNVDWDSVNFIPSIGEIYDKKVNGDVLTFYIKYELKKLSSKLENVYVDVSINSSNHSSRFWIYEPENVNNCRTSGSDRNIQRVLLSEPDPTVLKVTVNNITLDPSVCNVTDYSIDAACTNCYDIGSDASRASYIIQDTTNWEGILRSDDKDYICNATAGKKTNLSSYYKTTIDGQNVYCREEVKIVFPNANDTPTVERGRYFTVHSPYSQKYIEEIKHLNENRYDHNWGSIKVVKKKQCRMKGYENDASFFISNDKLLRFNKNVTIKLTYKGKNEDGASNDDEKELNKYRDKLVEMELEPESKGEFGSGMANSSLEIGWNPYKNADGTVKSRTLYTTTQTTTYKLKDGIFRYVLKGDGIYVSEEDIKNKDEGTYIDLGISAVPVSSKNKVFTDEDATLSLSFKLSDDMHLSNSFKKDNDFLPTCGLSREDNNIYNYALENGTVSKDNNSVTNLSNETDVEKAKIDLLVNSACAKLHMCEASSNGIKNCKAIKNGKDKDAVSTVKDCMAHRTNNKLGDDGYNCFTNSEAKPDGNSNYICAVYVDPGIPSANPVDSPDCPGCACKVSNDVYYGKSGGVISKEEYEKECKANPGKDGKAVSGSSKIIYRTIDLDNPFPGQDGKNRLTGVNWCSANDNGYITSCKWDNNVVKEHILSKGESIYGDKENVMYEVTLTSDTIDAIRSYNNTHSYDDFTLVCDAKTGENCKSEFVSKYVTRNK